MARGIQGVSINDQESLEALRNHKGIHKQIAESWAVHAKATAGDGIRKPFGHWPIEANGRYEDFAMLCVRYDMSCMFQASKLALWVQENANPNAQTLAQAKKESDQQQNVQHDYKAYETSQPRAHSSQQEELGKGQRVYPGVQQEAAARSHDWVAALNVSSFDEMDKVLFGAASDADQGSSVEFEDAFARMIIGEGDEQAHAGAGQRAEMAHDEEQKALEGAFEQVRISEEDKQGRVGAGESAEVAQCEAQEVSCQAQERLTTHEGDGQAVVGTAAAGSEQESVAQSSDKRTKSSPRQCEEATALASADAQTQKRSDAARHIVTAGCLLRALPGVDQQKWLSVFTAIAGPEALHRKLSELVEASDQQGVEKYVKMGAPTCIQAKV